MPWNLSHFLRYVVEICENNLAIFSFNSVLNISFKYYLSKTCIVQTPNVTWENVSREKKNKIRAQILLKKKKSIKKNGINVSNQVKFLFNFLIVQFWPSNMQDFGAVHNFFLNLCYHESFVSLERQVINF